MNGSNVFHQQQGSNPFENTAWLRSVIWLLVHQQGGQVELDLTPAFDKASGVADKNVGQLRFSIPVDGRSMTLVAKGEGEKA
jgi:hypothetical protein